MMIWRKSCAHHNVLIIRSRRSSTLTVASVQAMNHPRCVGWGEIGLDYHYDHSPREVQQGVLTRQLREAVKLHKPLTIHTREAEADTERILKAEVPEDHPVCLTMVPLGNLLLSSIADPHPLFH